jgi:hypothetical protein
LIRSKRRLSICSRLGLTRKKNELNDGAELADLADAIKKAMYDDYKTAYGEKGDKYEQEAKSTVNL